LRSSGSWSENVEVEFEYVGMFSVPPEIVEWEKFSGEVISGRREILRDKKERNSDNWVKTCVKEIFDHVFREIYLNRKKISLVQGKFGGYVREIDQNQFYENEENASRVNSKGRDFSFVHESRIFQNPGECPLISVGGNQSLQVVLKNHTIYKIDDDTLFLTILYQTAVKQQHISIQ